MIVASYRLPPSNPDEKPSYLNSGALWGAGFGALLGSPLPIIGNGTGALIGGLVGSYMSHNAQVERKYGKEVGEPSFFNSKAILGAAVGAGLSIAAGFIPVVGPLITWAGFSLMTAIGAVAGSFTGRAQMANDYSDAQQYQVSKELAARAPSVASPYVNVVTPEQSAALSAAQAAGRAGGSQGQFTGAVLGAQPGGAALSRNG